MELLTAGVELDAALGVVTGANLHDTWIAWRIDLASDRSWMIDLASQAVVALFLMASSSGSASRRKRAIEAVGARRHSDAIEE